MTSLAAEQSQEAGAQAMPKVLSGVAPYLQVSDASAAAQFYIKAFGAREVGRYAMEDGERLMHCHLYINGASVMLMDPMPEYGFPLQPVQSVTLHMQVESVDAWWARAVDAGAEVVMPLELQFWGDRYGQLRDPFGVLWSLGETPTA